MQNTASLSKSLLCVTATFGRLLRTLLEDTGFPVPSADFQDKAEQDILIDLICLVLEHDQILPEPQIQDLDSWFKHYVETRHVQALRTA